MTAEEGRGADGNSGDLARQLDELTDLFRRRLLDDREKSRAISILQAQLDDAREGVRRLALEPIVRQLILVLDRLDTEAGNSELLDSVSSELLDILAQYGVVRVTHNEKFDSTLAESTGVQVTHDINLDGTVAHLNRPAYLWSGNLLRPAAVTVWRYDPD